MPNARISNEIPAARLENVIPSGRISSVKPAGTRKIQAGMPYGLLLLFTYSRATQTTGDVDLFRPSVRITNA
jgi:hypothetical protein